MNDKVKEINIDDKKKVTPDEDNVIISIDRYKSIVNNTQEVILLFNKNLKIIYMNLKAEKITGTFLSKITGKTPSQAGFTRNFCTRIDYFSSIITDKNSIHTEILHVYDKDWDTIFIPEFNTNQNITGFLMYMFDISIIKENKYTQLMKENMTLKAQRLISQKTLYTAIAHEIKQPLQLIKMITDTIILRLNKENDNSEIIEKNLLNLNELHNGIDQIDSIINAMRTTINNNKNDILLTKCDITILIENIVQCEDTLIHQLIGNILNNSIEAFDNNNKNKQISDALAKIMSTFFLRPPYAIKSHYRKPHAKIRDKNSIFARGSSIKTFLKNDNFCIDIINNGNELNEEIKKYIFNPDASMDIIWDSLSMGLFIVQTILLLINGSIEIFQNQKDGTHSKISVKVE